MVFHADCEAYAYELMKVSVVIAQHDTKMDYEDIWELAKTIYEKWQALRPGDAGTIGAYAYIQEYTAEYLNEEWEAV